MARTDPRPHYGQRKPSVMQNGYVRVYRPGHPMATKDGYAYEHRLVLCEAGIDPRGMEVHHRNHDRQDNRLENLEVKAPGVHQQEHHQESGATITNQYGVWPVLRGEARQERNRELDRQARARRRQRQFLPSTWRANGGSGLPQNASPAEQDRIAAKVYAEQGTRPWHASGC